MKLVINIDEKIYESVMDGTYCGTLYEELKNGTLAHCRLIDADAVYVDSTSKIIEADKKRKVEIITRGNCMMCGKELDEGLFFCKECEAKSESEDKKCI